MNLKNKVSLPILALVAFCIISNLGCETKRSHKHNREIDCYRHQNDDNTWLYYYVMFDSHSGTYYSYQSPAPVSTFGGLTWTSSKVDPTETPEFQSHGFDEQPGITVPSSELPDEIEVDLEAGDPAVEGSDGGSNVEEPEEGSSESSESGSDGSSGGDSGSGGGDGD